MKILVVGDVHNNFGKLNALINVKRPELIICCGEFGYWPQFPKAKQLSEINTHGVKLLWVDGNHEDFSSLMARDTDELAPNIVYMPRGSTYTLPDKRRILFMGGANSIDKDIRTPGLDWFPEETISHGDMLNLPGGKIDIVVSHTCPRVLVPYVEPWKGEVQDPSTLALSTILEMYSPDLWYFAHWHTYRKGAFQNTSWTCLSMIDGHGRWWDWMTEKKKGDIMAGKRRKKVERKRGKKGRASKNQKKKV